MKTKRILRNAFWNVGCQVWNQLLYFFVTPLLLGVFGLKTFGLYTLYLSMTMLCVVFNLGIPTAMTRFLASHKETVDSEIHLYGMAIVGGLFVVSIGGVAALCGFLFVPDFIYWWQPNVDDLTQLTTLARLGCLLMFTAQINGFLNSILNGLKRYDVTSVLSTAGLTAQVVLILTALGLSQDIVGVAVAHLWGASLYVLVLVVVVWKFIGPHRHKNPALRPHVNEMFRLLRFSIPIHVSSLAWEVDRNFGKYFLLNFSGLQAVSLFEIASRIISAVHILVFRFSEVFLPESADLWSGGKKREFVSLFWNTSRLIGFLAFLFYGAIFVGAPAFFKLWLQDPQPQLVWMLRILLVGASMGLAVGGTEIFTLGLGKSTSLMHRSLVKVGVTISIAFGLASVDPILSLCVGMSVGSFIGIVVITNPFLKAIEFPRSKYYLRLLIPLSVSAWVPCLVLIAIPSRYLEFFDMVSSDRFRAFGETALICSLFMISFFLVNVVLGYLKKDDIQLLFQLFSKKKSAQR
jgi:O-antigen/teichoic acid export membrane protein